MKIIMLLENAFLETVPLIDKEDIIPFRDFLIGYKKTAEGGV